MKTISIARRVSLAAAALAGVLALAQPIAAQARGGGGGGHGGGHGGGFSGGGFGGGGFSGGGFHGGMFGAGGFSGSQGGGFHGAHFGGRDGFRNRGGFDGWSGGEWGWDAPYYDNGYGNSDYGADGYTDTASLIRRSIGTARTRPAISPMCSSAAHIGRRFRPVDPIPD